jgi:hypothetical protein
MIWSKKFKMNRYNRSVDRKQQQQGGKYMDAINDYRVWELEDLSDMTTVIELETGHILVLNF